MTLAAAEAALIVTPPPDSQLSTVMHAGVRLQPPEVLPPCCTASMPVCQTAAVSLDFGRVAFSGWCRMQD